ncbi:MAG: hypothetical protein WCA35_22775 [Kovacikia sp.]
MNERITRIVPGEKITYDRVRDERPIEHCYVEFVEQARPEFYIALNALVPFVIQECGLEEVVWKDSELSRLTLRHFRLNEMGFAAQIRMKRESKVALLQNLPYLPAEEIDAALQLKLVEICKEATYYIQGRRAQLGLFETGESA